MSISARVDEALIAYLDSYQKENNVKSRSEALEQAIKALQERDLDREYALAMAEWADSGDAELWDQVAGDGLMPTKTLMRRGEIYLANLDPIRGSEANKTRPVVVVSRDALNRVAKERGRGVVTVVPLSSNVEQVYSFQVLLPAEVTALQSAGGAGTGASLWTLCSSP